jgi:hypothetical protein
VSALHEPTPEHIVSADQAARQRRAAQTVLLSDVRAARLHYLLLDRELRRLSTCIEGVAKRRQQSPSNVVRSSRALRTTFRGFRRAVANQPRSGLNERRHVSALDALSDIARRICGPSGATAPRRGNRLVM